MDDDENVGGEVVQMPNVVGMQNPLRDPLIPEWVRQRGEALAWFAFQCLALCVMVVVGTALGNGVPMARSTGEAFRVGVQAGLKSCPCANKPASGGGGPTPLAGPTPLSQPAALKPIADPGPVSLKPVSEVVK